MQRREVDLVDGGVALAGRDPVAGDVLGGDDADAVGRAGGGAERAADALLQAGVLEACAACGGRGSAGRPGVFSSGYWIVIGPSISRAIVVFSPRRVSPKAR